MWRHTAILRKSFTIALGCVVSVIASAGNMWVSTLSEGDILLCEPYPYRTVTNTARTVYQIAALGHRSIRSFQRAHGLKDDNIVGPRTQQTAESEFAQRIARSTVRSTDALALAVRPTVSATSVVARVALRNISATPLRIVGALTYGPDGSFKLVEPSTVLHAKTCTRKGRLVACGGRSYTVALSANGTVLNHEAEAAGLVSLPALAPAQSCNIYASVTYLCADLVERYTEADVPLSNYGKK